MTAQDKSQVRILFEREPLNETVRLLRGIAGHPVNPDPGIAPFTETFQEALRLLESSQGVVAILLMMLVMLFVFITLLSMAGGALGAKFASRNQ